MHQSTESTVFVPSHPLHGNQNHANCPFLTHTWSQVAAAFAELAIPHFATSSIFAAATTGATSASFQHYLQLLGVLVVVFGVSAALRGYCFSVLNNRMTMRLRCGAGVGCVVWKLGFTELWAGVGGGVGRVHVLQCLGGCTGQEVHILHWPSCHR